MTAMCKGANGVRTANQKRICLICGTKYETSYGRKTCGLKECFDEHRRRKDKLSHEARKKPGYNRRGDLVPSICPMCRRPHKAETRHNYCRLCKAAVQRGHLPDQYEGGRVFSNTRSHAAAM